MDKSSALDRIESNSELFYKLSDSVWDTPELGFHEETAAKLQIAALKELDFTDIKTNLAGLPTAFSASYGKGKPVIAVMGEFDALSGLSQAAGSAEYKPLVQDGNGHGCGHNLLGTGALAAAYGIKEYLSQKQISGTVVYFGCPAEENGSGKTFMAREGVFDGIDFTLYWHPGVYNKVGSNTCLANYAVKYRFKGISAHAAASPHTGRSALDAVELMNVGVQYLREHVPSTVRIHYAITDTGGVSPNVVQSKAEVYYLIRAPKVKDVQKVYERVNKIAQGATLMTDTKLEIAFEKACSEQLINQNMNDILQSNLEAVPIPAIEQDETDFANAIRDSIEEKGDPVSSLKKQLGDDFTLIEDKPIIPLCGFVYPRIKKVGLDYASGDLGDVSKICPTGELGVGVWAVSTRSHSWQATAQGKSSRAHKMMIYAAKVLAGAGIDLLENPQKAQAAKEEFLHATEGEPYVCPIPKDVPIPKD